MISKSHWNKIEGLVRRRSDIHIDFLKYLLLLSSTLFGLLVALNKQNNLQGAERYIFPLAMICIVVGILCGAAALYGEVHSLNHLLKSHLEELRNSLLEKREPVYTSVSTARIFLICERICFVFLILAAILLTVYSFLVVG